MFELRHYQPWTFAAFAVVLLQTILTYMLAGLVFPDLFGEEIVGLRESFYAHRVWFFALGFFVVLVSIGKVAVLYRELPHPDRPRIPCILWDELSHRGVARSQPGVIGSGIHRAKLRPLLNLLPPGLSVAAESESCHSGRRVPVLHER